MLTGYFLEMGLIKHGPPINQSINPELQSLKIKLSLFERGSSWKLKATSSHHHRLQSPCV